MSPFQYTVPSKSTSIVTTCGCSVGGGGSAQITVTCAIDVALYLASYFARLRFMSRNAKSTDPDTNRRYFVEEQLVASDDVKTPSSWSRDGRYLLYHSTDPQTSSDLWVAPVGAGRPAPFVFLRTPSREVWGAFSPDGRWVAYMSNESGRPQIYVRPFVPPGAAVTGGQWQISTAGGIHPVWRPDGRELYYLDPVGALVSVPVAASGATFEPGTPMVRFATQILGGGVDAGQGRQYDIAPDGRLLINTVIDNVESPITLLQRWGPEGR